VSSDLRERLGIDNSFTVIQRYGLRWYGHVFKKG